MTRSVARSGAWLAGACLLMGIGLGRPALLDPDEPRYAAAAREMAAGGDLVVPRFNGEPRINKPPLAYWAMAASFRLLGPGELQARLPSAAAALACLGLVFWIGQRRPGAETGGPAAAALSATPLFFACGRLATPDMLLCLFVTGTLAAWRESVARPAGARWPTALLSAVCCGLAVLTKGPVGALLPAAIIAATAAWRRERRLVSWRGLVLGAAGAVLIGAPWAAMLVGRVGRPAVLETLKRELLERALTGLDHPRPIHYLVVSFCVVFFPWTIVLAKAVRLREASFEVCWAIVPVVVLSLSTDKNDAWLLPAAPGLALLAARLLSRRVVAVAACAAGVALLGAVLLGSDELSRRRSLGPAVAAAGLAGRQDYELISYRLHRPSLVWYAGRSARWIASGADLRQALAVLPPGRAVAIVMEERRLTATPLTGFERIGGQPGYAVLFREGESALALQPP